MTEPAFDELLALNSWGVVRGTKDVDVVVASDPENPLMTGEQTAIETDLGRLDIVQGLDGVPGYEELRARASEVEILGVTVAVCSLDDLKAMKRAASRTRDLADLEDLEAAGD